MPPKPPLLDRRYSRFRTLLPEERELWRRAAEGQALPPRDRLPESRESLDAVLPPAMARPRPPVSPHSAPTLMDDGLQDRIKTGKTCFDARLDLHGYTLEAAYTALLCFLASATTDGVRTALIITGKGRNESPDTLRALLPRWLSGPPLSEYVLSTAQADVRHGGDGAWYVRMRWR